MPERVKSMNSKSRSGKVGRGFRFVKGDMDGALFAIVVALLVIGITMMFSASYPEAVADGLSGTFYASRQLLFAGIGVVAMLIFSFFVDYHIFQKLIVSGSAFLIGIILLILVLFIGKEVNGAQRWLVIGGENGMQFQPSELMKVAIVLFFSLLIDRNSERMHKFKYGIIPFMAMLGIVDLLMVAEPHISGTIIITVLALTLLFVGGAKPAHFAILCAVAGVVLFAVVMFLIKVKGMGYFEVRILSWRDPFNEEYMKKETWQTCQSLIAIGSGGMFGLGLGASRQKYQYLPEAQNDFVFAILCEEFGFVGAATVILLFCLLIFRGFYIAAKAKDKYGMLVAIGLTMHIGLQALLNIAVVSNAIPNTGISLPFFSYGGTALVMQLCEMGILLNISRQAKLE
ncbi:MAG: putative lipid II flippase FtsW [Oscillospiraceae bacterium]|nr:putative lipid II flippase FtsW [Oscillospiraceae bacterium]